MRRRQFLALAGAAAGVLVAPRRPQPWRTAAYPPPQAPRPALEALQLDAATRRALEAMSRDLLAWAKRQAPIDTGALARSLAGERRALASLGVVR